MAARVATGNRRLGPGNCGALDGLAEQSFPQHTNDAVGLDRRRDGAIGKGTGECTWFQLLKGECDNGQTDLGDVICGLLRERCGRLHSPVDPSTVCNASSRMTTPGAFRISIAG
ncbi:hypothetical protein WBP07_21235 (plasmid) [Novosphingobium sp. BL-8A]|uniref:hypothetical protein n=1 Tax=Novosphingobium sp. BL-8A TaxID=3127639 RepID=UPI003758238E